jgi:hypothetical protein
MAKVTIQTRREGTYDQKQSLKTILKGKYKERHRIE